MEYSIIKEIIKGNNTISEEIKTFSAYSPAQKELHQLANKFHTKIEVDEIGKKFDCIWKNFVTDKNGYKYFICEKPGPDDPFFDLFSL